jgi:hypothetical protein
VLAWVESTAKLSPRADPELSKRSADVHLDRLDGEEELLSDLPVGQAGCRHLGDAPLRRGQRVDPAHKLPAYAPACRAELLDGALDQPVGVAAAGEIDRRVQWLTGCGALVPTAQSRAEVHQRMRVQQTGGRMRQGLHGALKQLDPDVPSAYEPGHAQRVAEQPGRSEAAREAQVLVALRQRPATLTHRERAER